MTGKRVMEHCTREAVRHGFKSLELVATLPGEPPYLASGFKILERFNPDLPGGHRMPVSRMRRRIAPDKRTTA